MQVLFLCFFCIIEKESFEIFALLIELVTATAMCFSFRFFKWDVAKGLLGGVLFCLMYQEAHLALARLWVEQDFDVYLSAGVQGSLFLAGAGMNLLMTVLITLNHFFINYSTHGNPKNVILNRIALIFKFAVCILLLAANSQMDYSRILKWIYFSQYLMDIALLLLVTCLEAQFDSFNVLRQELRNRKQDSESKTMSIRERISGCWLMVGTGKIEAHMAKAYIPYPVCIFFLCDSCVSVHLYGAYFSVSCPDFGQYRCCIHAGGRNPALR